VQIWERARQQLAVPHGKTNLIAIGCELSLWNPLLLDWLVRMRKTYPMTAVQAHVGLPDQMLEQLRTGVLDIAILYAPRLLPGIKVELLIEEKLVLVRGTKREPHLDNEEYVHVDWGPVFAAQHGETSALHGPPRAWTLGIQLYRTGWRYGLFPQGYGRTFSKNGCA
jgi:DNA-binding transcriptional LysR family regulator